LFSLSVGTAKCLGKKDIRAEQSELEPNWDYWHFCGFFSGKTM